MFLIVGAAIWFSMQNDSGVELWLALLMILLSLVYLLEASDPLRELQISVLPFDPPSTETESRIPILISNPTQVPSQPLFLQLKGSRIWIATAALPAKSSELILLPFSPSKPGKQNLPSVRIKMFPPSKLFRFWRQIDPHVDFQVIAKAEEPQPLLERGFEKNEESDLADPELIRDPRMLPKMDRKLFQKTGLAYHRPILMSHSNRTLQARSNALKKLSEENWVEPFSQIFKQPGFLVFFPLAAVTYLFRNVQGGVIAFVISMIVVILFWYFQSMKFALNSLRNIVVLLAGLSLILYTFGDRLSFFSSKAKLGGAAELELNPATIGRLKGSHETAIELFLDHRPPAEDRYFKTGTFDQTDDGLRYSVEKRSLNISRMPKTAAWIHGNLQTTSVKEASAAIEHWWREGFRYSLSPGTFDGAHPLDEFLFDRKIGFCEHYAAALATLLKLDGFEARVVVGYSGGSWNPVLQKLTYEEADAHAWVEARNPGTKLWLRLDPTLWVSPKENLRGEDFSTLYNMAVVTAGILLVFFGLQLGRFDPREKFLNKLEKLEQRNQLFATGLTVTERVEHLVVRQPSLEQKLRDTLSAYQDTYFAAEPHSQSVRRFSKLLRRW